VESNVLTEAGLAETGRDDRYFLSQGQGDRFGRWIEFLSAVVLSLATVLTAWCGYQAALRGGEQARCDSMASAMRIMATQNENEALLRPTMHVGLFVDCLSSPSARPESRARR
jgi:hypothetical protein